MKNQAPLCLDRWWPERLGSHPDWVGAVDGVRYAYFSASSRLVLENNDGQDIYDTGEHRLKSADSSRWAMKLEFRDESGKIVGLGTFERITRQ